MAKTVPGTPNRDRQKDACLRFPIEIILGIGINNRFIILSHEMTPLANVQDRLDRQETDATVIETESPERRERQTLSCANARQINLMHTLHSAEKTNMNKRTYIKY